MRDFFFVLRMVGITFFVLLVMQIQVNNRTLEERSLAWIRTSPYVEELQKVADGAVIVAKKTWGTITSYFNDDFFRGFRNEHKPGERFKAGIQRSREFLEDTAKDAQEKLKKLQEEHNKRERKSN